MLSLQLFEDSSEATAPKEAITLQEPTTAVGSKKEDGNFWASIKASVRKMVYFAMCILGIL